MVTKKEKRNFSLIPYRRDNNWGYCDNNFNIKIPIRYDEALPFSEGLAGVRLGKSWGFINKNGQKVIEFKYQSVSNFKNSNAVVNGNDLKLCLVINKKGKVIRSYDPKDEMTAEEFDNLISNYNYYTKYVYIIQNGQNVISELNSGYLDSAGNFVEGKHVAELKFKKDEMFEDGLAPVEINGKWNFTDKSWQLLFHGKITYAEFLDESSKKENDDYFKESGLDDLDDFWKDFFSSTTSPLEQDGFDEVRNFSEGLAAVKIKDKWGFINTMGKVVIKCKYYDSSDSDFYLFRDGIAKVIDSSMNISFIDKTGKRYFEFFEDVLKRELNYTLTNNINSVNQYPLLFQALNTLKYKNNKELKALLVDFIMKNKIKFKYDQNTVNILETLKKQIKTLIKLFQKSDIKSEDIQKLIFSLIQYLDKIDYEYYDLDYTEYYDQMNKEFFKKLQNDFIIEILVNKMIGYYERNRLLELFRLCKSLQEGKEIEIELKNIKYYESVFNKFSLENSIVRTKDLLKLLSDSFIDKSAMVNENNSESNTLDDIKLINNNKSDDNSFKIRSLARLLIKQPKFFIEVISHNYPFNQIELKQWQEYLDWRLVSCNSRIQFDIDLVDHFKHRLFWTELSKNKTIHWGREILSSCISFLCRPSHILGNPISNISRSGNVKWSIALIEEFKEKWDWQELSSNNNLPWSDELIKRFSPFWDWKSLCVNGKFWNEDIIASLENELDQNYERWNHLLSNPHIQWSKELIYKYKEKWFSAMPFTGYHAYDVYANTALPWDEEFVEVFKDKFNWYRLSKSNVLPWSEKFIHKFSQYWVWKALANNASISWDEKLITKFEDKLSLTELHMSLFDNPSVKWNKNLIDKYIDKINWRVLSQNININWTFELIDKYIEKLDWSYLSANTSIPWSYELIDRYIEKLDWNNLNYKTSIIWSVDLIHKYSSKINFHRLLDNEDINWDYELIEKFKDVIDWYGFCRINKNWNAKIIDKFNEYFCWDILAHNTYFPWSLELIKIFHSRMFNENDVTFYKHYLKTTDPKDLNYYEYLYLKYETFYGISIPKDLEYLNFLVKLYPDFKLKYPSNDLYFYLSDEFDNSVQDNEINKLGNPILNNISIYLLMNLIIQDNTFIKFLNEKETEKLEQEYQLAEKRSEWESNYMSRSELVALGYLDDDIDDISEVDI